MVKIKSAMSVETTSDGGSEALSAATDKLKIHQRLIDISARSLLSSRASSADLSQSMESQCALEVQRENSSIQEVRSYLAPPPSRHGAGRPGTLLGTEYTRTSVIVTETVCTDVVIVCGEIAASHQCT